MNTTLLNSIRFVVFFALQILLFNNINLFGYLNPFPYILFILLFPVNGNKLLLLVSSFLLGIILDSFENSGGIHALSSVTLAFIRPTLFKFSFGLSYEYQTIKITDKIRTELITLLFLSILIHHFILFFFEIFRIDLILVVLTKTLYSTLFTFVISLLIIFLIKPNKR